MSKTVPAFIVRNFDDAGTKQSFKAGSVEEIGEGPFGNYAASGLVREPSAAELKAAKAAKDAPKD